MISVPPLQRNLPITDDKFLPSGAYHIWWQNFVKALVDTINSQQDQIAQIQAAMDAASAANKSAARIGSYTVPTNVLSGVDAGSDAKIVIASHTRVYPSNSGVDSVAVVGTELTGKSYSTTYYVYYDDPTLTDTTPTFLTTTDPATAQVGASSSRHFVGVITTPASGGGSSSGGGGTPPGGGGGPIP